MNSKISELDLVSVVDQNDVLPIVNGGITKKVKVSQLEQNLQSVTDKGAVTTNEIIVNTNTSISISGISIDGTGIYGESIYSIGVKGYSETGTAVQGHSETGNGISAYSTSGIPIETYGDGNGTPSVEVNLGNTNKGVVIESGESSTGNPIEVNKNGVLKLIVNQNGEITANQYKVFELNTAPASATATGTLGEIRYTADFIYVCIATDTWKRTALTTW